MRLFLSFILMLSALAPARAHQADSFIANDGARLAKKSDSDRHSKDEDPCLKGDQQPAPCRSWLSPLGKPRLAVLCIHGLGLNSNSYEAFGKRMMRFGVAVYAIDVRGFGSWMNSQGHDEVDFDGCLCDVKRALLAIRQANPGLPVFLLGESMGGAIAMRACSLYPELVDGLISAVPAGERFQQKRTDLKVAFEFLTGPNRQHGIENVVDQATKNDRLKEDWESDPLNRMQLSPKELWQFQRFMNDNHDAAKKIDKTPVLFMQGTEDRLVKPEGTWDLFNDLATPEKTFIALPSEHLIYEEGEAKTRHFDQRVARLTWGWISNFTDLEDRLPGLRPRNASNSMMGGVPSPPASSSATDLQPAIDLINQGKFQEAESMLNVLMQADEQNPEAHYWLGMAYSKMNKPVLARRELTLSMRLSNGRGRANEVNRLMLAMPSNSSDDSGNSKADILAQTSGITRGAPTVLVFWASWADQCQGIDQLFAQARRTFGNRVNLIKVDVEDKNNDALVKALNVGPIPTTVYLQADGTVASTQIGRQTAVNFNAGVRTIAGAGLPGRRLNGPLQRGALMRGPLMRGMQAPNQLDARPSTTAP